MQDPESGGIAAPDADFEDDAEEELGDPSLIDGLLAAAPPPSHTPEPQTLDEIGINVDRLADLALKICLVTGSLSARELADRMALPAYLVQDLADHLRRSKLVEFVVGPDREDRTQRYGLTDGGRDRAEAALSQSRYVGPTPVPIEAYREVIRRGARRRRQIGSAALQSAFSSLAISPEVVDQLGPAACAGRSLFIFGAPGNGKTTLAEAIGRAGGDEALVPYAIEARGEIIQVYDVALHEPIAPAAADADNPFARLLRKTVSHDRRWVRVKRPLIVAGGELTMDSLELTYNPTSRVHQAPSQLKANGGTFLIDDFGRQRMRPEDLLNRWIVPLEKARDYLRLASGDVIEVPFSTLLILATNLQPRDLIDEAFVRRIKYTVELPDPTPDQYHRIFQICCERAGITYDAPLIDDLIARYYHATGQPMRGCHPRDLVERICDQAAYEGTEPRLDRAAIDRACAAYFKLRGTWTSPSAA